MNVRTIPNVLNRVFRLPILALMLVSLVGCFDAGPGPLKGTWKSTGEFPMVVVFRNGETEALGIIEHVSFEQKGRDVIVTYKDGLMKGNSVRFTVVDANTLTSGFGNYTKVR